MKLGRILTSCAALALLAGAAQAATYGTLTSTGDVTLSASTPRTLTLDGSATGSIIGDPSVVRNYTLNYDFSFTPSAGPGASISGSQAVGSFALTDFYPFLASAGSSGSFMLPNILTGSYENLTLGAPDSTVDYQLTLSGNATGWLIDELGYSLPSYIGEVNGTYNLSASLVSTVPVPAALPLLLTGFAGFAGVSARKRRKQKAA